MDKLALTRHSVTLSNNDKAIIESRKSKKIKDCTGIEISQALGYILILLGENAQRIDDFAKSPAKGMVIKSLLRALPNFRIEELKTAFDLATDKEFEVNLSLYNRTFNSEYIMIVVKAYKDYRKTSLVKEQKMLDTPKPEPTTEQKQKIVQEGIKEAYVKYKESGILPKPCAWIYQELENSGGISHTVEEKKEFYSQAQEKENNRLEVLKKSSDFLGVKEILKEQENINSNKLKTIAREIALKSYWDEMIISEKL